MSRILIMSMLFLACQYDVAGTLRALRDLDRQDHIFEGAKT